MKIEFKKKFEDIGFVENFIESNDKQSKKDYYELFAKIVPFNKISRNKVMYDTESIKRTYKQIQGIPLMFNHVINGDVLPRGEWVESYIKEDGLYGKAKVFNTEYNKDLIEYLQHASKPKVSLQISGEAESMSDENGKLYRKATINEWLEISIVNVSGYEVANAQLGTYLAENLNVETEDNTMANSDDILTNKIIKKKDNSEDKELEEYYKKLKEILCKYK